MKKKGEYSAVSANPATSPPPLNQSVTAYFFYGDGCSHCDAIKSFVGETASRYPTLDFEQREVYHNATSQARFIAMDKTLGIDSPEVPTIIIGNQALVGEDQIRDRLDAAIRQELASSARSQTGNAAANSTVPGNCPGTVSALTVPLVLLCAGIASINPCGLAVLAILLLSIIVLQTRRQVLMVGITYIAAVFLFYFISGLGFLSFIDISGLGISSLIATAAAAIAIVLGAVNIVDAAWKKEGFILAIPGSKKPVIEQYISTATLPAAFVLGVLVGIFELPCAGGSTLTILGLMSNTMTLAEGIPYLLLFNVIFILPLILLLLVVVFGIAPERVNTWRLENRRMLRFAIGLAMVAVGIVILLAPSFH